MASLADWLVDPSLPLTPPSALPPRAFRYMSSDGLLATIHSRRIRMNAWSRMNDPREAMQWSSTGTLRATGSYTEAEMRKRLDDVLRRSACLLSMTSDRLPVAGADPSALFHRGWGRAPLWAHYADNHRGVCLVLDPFEVHWSLDQNVPILKGRYSTQGCIKYRDGPISVDLSGSFADQASLDDALVELLDSRWVISGLHMTKNTDWSYETELRIAAINLDLDGDQLDTPIDVPMGDSLKAVIFGDQHASPSVLAQGIRGALGTSSPEFFQCRWIHGAPTLEPLKI